MRRFFLGLGLLATVAGAYVYVAGKGFGPDGQLTWSLTNLSGNLSAQWSGDTTVMGHRGFEARVEDGALTLTGAAFTFEDLRDPATFVPYAFRLESGVFVDGPIDADPFRSFEANDATRPDVSGVDLASCINPRPEGLSASGIALNNPVLCHLNSALEGQRPAMIGVIHPADPTLTFESGDDTCRAEIAHWQSLDGFHNRPIVLCIVVDQPFDPAVSNGEFWMDVIFYQQLGTRLYNMRAARRNFQRI